LELRVIFIPSRLCYLQGMFERLGESVGVGQMEWEIRRGERYSWISKGDKEGPGGGVYTGRRAVQGEGGGWRHGRREGIREKPVRIPYRYV
jgi:hypothetical protein